MKVLLISDNEENIDFVSSFMASHNYDVIVYNWIIKAIDNIQEIKPNIIIVSAAEYPRHWKTLTSFVSSGIGGKDVKVFLYEPTPLSDEETKKAKALGIEGCFSKLDNESFEKYFAENKTKNNFSSQIIITNPDDGSLLTGSVISLTENSCTCKIFSDTLKIGQDIDHITVYSNGSVSFFSAKLTDNNKDEGILLLSLSDNYEEI